MTSTFSPHHVQQAGRQITSVIRPTSVRAALEALGADHEARPIAGGTDLLLDLQRGGPGAAVTVVDLTTIDGFRAITDAGDSWVIAGGVTHNQIVRHDGLRHTALPLAQACLEIGSPQLRNRATLAGNLATASPANDSISALMALGASVEVSKLDAGGVVSRVVPIDQFFSGFRETILAPGELITAITVPKLSENQDGIWVKLGLRRAQAISVVHAGIVIARDGDIVTSARLAIGSVAATVLVVDDFETALVGKPLSPESIAAASTAAAEAVTPITDGRATAEYRTDGISVLLRRALLAILAGENARMWPTDPPTLSNDAQLVATAPPSRSAIDVSTTVAIDVNGQVVSAPNATKTLLDWIREDAGQTGMKEGCAEGECGACTMYLDGAAVMSCLVAAAQADGRAVSTIEGLHDHPIQQAFIDDFAVQCGFCIPGFLMSGARLLEETNDPTDDQIQLALSGNLCRCTGYYPISEAVRDAAVVIRGGADA